MRTWTEQKGFIPDKDLQLFELVKVIMRELPSYEVAVSCHVICRAISNHLPQLEVRSGHFISGGWTHSWLVTPAGNVIDAYPWAAVGGPMLLCTKIFSPWSHAYQARPLHLTHDDLRLQDELTQAVGRVVKELIP